MAIQLFVSLIEFKLTTLAGFVLVPSACSAAPPSSPRRCSAMSFSSGVKVLVLAVIVGIGSTIFGQFTSGFNNPPTIDDALTLILAALALLGLTIFGPGIANGLIAGGPQLGAGAAVGTGLAAGGGIGAAGAAATAGGHRRRRRRDRRRGAGRARRSRAVPPQPTAPAAQRASRRRRVPSRRARCAARRPACVRASQAGERAAMPAARRPVRCGRSRRRICAPPAWAQPHEAQPDHQRGVSAADHAVRSGDHPSGGSSVDLSEGDLTMFRRSTVRYGTTPEPETPYQRAGQVWDERIGSARVQARNWRLAFFGALALSGGLAAGLVWQSARGTVTPWVVQVDKLGQAQAVAPGRRRLSADRSADRLASRALHRGGAQHSRRSRRAAPELARGLQVTSPTRARWRSTTMRAPTIRSPRSARPRSRSRSRA